jgi:quercetin dioxygenase-like cupin family protein
MKPHHESILDAELTEALANAIAPVELSAQERDRMRARILKRAAATAPSGMQTLRNTEGVWKAMGPGTEFKVLHIEPATNTRSILIRMEPGSRVPVHSHSQEEHCLVLEGEVTIGEHIFRSGDWHIAMPGTTHSDFSTRTGCLLFIRGEIPKHA